MYRLGQKETTQKIFAHGLQETDTYQQVPERGSHHHPLHSNCSQYYIKNATPANEDTKDQQKDLKGALQQNGYRKTIINKATHRKTKYYELQTDVKENRDIMLYVKEVTDEIGEILRRNNIRTTYKTTQTMRTIIV